MLTKEQKEKAKQAIFAKNKTDIEKWIALQDHLRALELYKTMQVPYRVALNHIKGRKANDARPIINECYPFPGYPVDKMPFVVYPNDFCIVDQNENGGILDEIRVLRAEKQAEIEEITAYYKPIDSVLGAKWQQNLAFFLVGYDFYGFSEFDLTGEQGKLAVEDIALLQKIYTRIQRGYLEHEKEYLDAEPTYTQEEMEQYQALPYRVLEKAATVDERERTLQRNSEYYEKREQAKTYIERDGVMYVWIDYRKLERPQLPKV